MASLCRNSSIFQKAHIPCVFCVGAGPFDMYPNIGIFNPCLPNYAAYPLKKYFIILFVTLFAQATFAQPVVHEQKHVDSLLRLIRYGASDSIRARASFLLSDFWSYTDTVKSRTYLEEGKRLAGSNAYMQAQYYFYEAGLIFDTDIDKALTLYAESARRFSPFQSTESYLFQARAWRNSGALLQRQSKGNEMVEIILTRAIPWRKRRATMHGWAVFYGCGYGFHERGSLRQSCVLLHEEPGLLQNGPSDDAR